MLPHLILVGPFSKLGRYLILHVMYNKRILLFKVGMFIVYCLEIGMSQRDVYMYSNWRKLFILSMVPTNLSTRSICVVS